MKKLIATALFAVVLCVCLVSQADAQYRYRVSSPGQGTMRIEVGDVTMYSGSRGATISGYRVNATGHQASQAGPTALALGEQRHAHVMTGFGAVFAPQPIVIQTPAPAAAPVYYAPAPQAAPAAQPAPVYQPAPAPAPAENCCVHCGRTGRDVVIVWVENTHWVCSHHRVGNGFADCQGHTWLWDPDQRVWLDP